MTLDFLPDLFDLGVVERDGALDPAVDGLS